jgi:hypothetical protein
MSDLDQTPLRSGPIDNSGKCLACGTLVFPFKPRSFIDSLDYLYVAPSKEDEAVHQCLLQSSSKTGQ